MVSVFKPFTSLIPSILYVSRRLEVDSENKGNKNGRAGSERDQELFRIVIITISFQQRQGFVDYNQIKLKIKYTPSLTQY